MELVLTPEQKELMKKQDADIIKDSIVEIQTLVAALNDKIDAFGREYKDDATNALIYIWTTSIDNSTSKVKRTSKGVLTSDGKPKTISADIYNIDVIYTSGGTTLDTQKFKKFDPAAYMSFARIYSKTTAPRAKVSVSEKKGVI